MALALIITKLGRPDKKRLPGLYSLYYAACFNRRQFSSLLRKRASLNEGQLSVFRMSSTLWNQDKQISGSPLGLQQGIECPRRKLESALQSSCVKKKAGSLCLSVQLLHQRMSAIVSYFITVCALCIHSTSSGRIAPRMRLNSKYVNEKLVMEIA